MKITARFSVKVPRVPNFLHTESGETIPVCAVSDEGLRELAKSWTDDLLKRAARQHREYYGKQRPAAPRITGKERDDE